MAVHEDGHIRASDTAMPVACGKNANTTMTAYPHALYCKAKGIHTAALLALLLYLLIADEVATPIMWVHIHATLTRPG